MASPKAKQARRRRIVVGLAAALVLAGGAGAYGMGLVGRKSDADRYRTATVSTGSVQELLTLQGSVARVNQETATFPADGTVTSVKVSVGQSVKAGDRLATLDTTPLTVAVLEAKAALAQAKQAYNDDYTAANASTASSTSSSSTSRTSTSPSGSSSGAATAQVAKAMAEVQKAVTAERAVCAPVLAAGGTASPIATRSAGAADHNPTPTSTSASTTTAEPAPSPSESSTPTPSESSTPTGSGTSTSGTPSPSTSTSSSSTSTPSSSPSSSAGPTAEQVAACAGAVSSLAAAEQKASAALTAAFTALSKTAAASASSSSSSAAASAAKAATGASSGAGGQSAASASARLASDKAGITTAEQNLSQAQDNLDGATLVAPITGVVGSVGFVAGGTATASTGVTVVGSGASTVTVSVPLASRSKVAVGQDASVLPAGATTALKGRITSISPLPTSSSSATYPAVVQVEDSPAALTTGALADVSITVGTSKDALTIPVSGLVPSSTTSGVVQVLGDGGAVSSVTVSVGAVGGGKVAILSGLTQGQKVVVADALQALPTNSTQNIGRLTSNGGGPGQAPGGTASRAAGGAAAPAGP